MKPVDINVKVPSIEGVKAHWANHKREYLIGGGCLVLGYLLHTQIKPPSYNIASIFVSGKNNTLENVSLISVARQGPPSWVVWCKETQQPFLSQRSAAFSNGIPEVTLSRHLNGLLENANGLHFERICMAA
jgi:hypothetical protein